MVLSDCGVDGMIIVWAPTTSPHASSYGSDLTPEDMQYEKEHWKPRTTFRYVPRSCFRVSLRPSRVSMLQVHHDAGLRPRLEPHRGVHHCGQHRQLRPDILCQRWCVLDLPHTPL